MKKVLLFVLPIIVLLGLGVGSYFLLTKNSLKVIKPADAKAKAEDYINKNLLPPGLTAVISEAVPVNGMYKLATSFSNGEKADLYITRDGKLLFPDALKVDEALKADQTQNQNAGDSLNNTTTMDLKIETLKQGTGDKVVKSGDTLTVDYTGTLEDGTKFDSSLDAGKPFTFTIGQGSVIKGWDQGLIGMKVGEERKLTIPASLGYGSTGAGDTIPPNATLIFTVKLISIK
jgi:hypothetical protein